MSRTPRGTTAREGRVPVSSNRSPLEYKGLDKKNFYHRWVKDRDDRIAMFLEAGYEFVAPTQKYVGEGQTVDTQSQAAEGSRVSKPSGDGKSRLFLMRLPMEYRKEDERAKAAAVDETEEAMSKPGKGRFIDEDIDYGKIQFQRSRRMKEVSNTPETADSDE